MLQTHKQATYPAAHISIFKNRLATQSGNKIYLENGANFEIELSNNTQSKFLAKIKFNGTSISNTGLILRPGEHVYLERFLDTNAKFLFDTYNIEDNANAKKAIEKNGVVEIKWYKEAVPFKEWLRDCIYEYEETKWVPYRPKRSKFVPWYGTSDCSGNFTFDSLDSTTLSLTNANLTGTITAQNCNFTNTSGIDNSRTKNSLYSAKVNTLRSKDIETGRVEEGERSNQIFQTASGDFNDYIFTTDTYYLLPLSQKPVAVKDIRNYCSGCGRRQKKGWEFCPTCGIEI